MAIDTKFIGKTWPEQSYDVSKEKIKEYAKAIKNLDPHYVDEEFAKKSKYGCIIAPPTFCVVFGANLIEPVFFDNELKLNLAMLVHGEQSFEFYEVVKAGDTITTSSRISHIENKEKLDVITVDLLSKNQHGRDVCKGIYTFVVRK
ncbi:MAG TPA: MaoC family dehydratase N-terminal domain-containing protein [Deltaproteobacteria bacterium]|jgi:acyl dehydratase|nr:MaoC family dehydratase N-terminal domain-containing protein [Deltaproteobacteria bacterium]HQJ07830.1 MaoC family dehydratase N-terminal domain-containing protein [Deltaproteobacteria bacterium]